MKNVFLMNQAVIFTPGSFGCQSLSNHTFLLKHNFHMQCDARPSGAVHMIDGIKTRKMSAIQGAARNIVLTYNHSAVDTHTASLMLRYAAADVFNCNDTLDMNRHPRTSVLFVATVRLVSKFVLRARQRVMKRVQQGLCLQTTSPFRPEYRRKTLSFGQKMDLICKRPRASLSKSKI
jgi:hypothetical protein